jgi:AraC family transcriptional regulator, positive regulator of tynA and feaB
MGLQMRHPAGINEPGRAGTTPVRRDAAAECRSVDAVTAADKQEAWQDILSAMLLPMTARLAPETRHSFQGRMRRQWLDDVALVECRTDPFTGRRGRAQIAPGDDECIAVLVDVSGHEYLSQLHTTVDLRSGSGIALSSTAEFRFSVPVKYQKRCLVVPAAALAAVRRVPGGCFELSRQMPATVLLDGYLSTLSRTLPAMSGHARTAARDAALALVAGALCADVDIGTQHATPALRAAMDAWIERHLRDRDLSPNSVAAAHAVSARTVYRLFSQDGDTFGAVVRQRRLDHVRQELASSDETVSSIAARWGFADASHLSRSFKYAFGMSPRDYRAARTVAEQPDRARRQ